MAERVLEGTKEVRAHDAELSGRHVRLVVTDAQATALSQVGVRSSEMGEGDRPATAGARIPAHLTTALSP